MTGSAIRIEGLEKQLGTFRLGPLDLTIPRGAIYALIGPNGAGKTTLLDLIMGMGQPDRGRIEVLGLPQPRDEVAAKRKIGYVNPDLNFQPWGSVGRAIAFMRGFYPDWNGAHCERLQREFALASDDKVATLSFGSRIKLALILALSRDAELLLLDEPTVGLDAGSRQKLFAELLAFMQREDRTILISSHQLADLERFADHVAILHHGELLLSGRMDELVGRYHQVDVRLTDGGAPAAIDGTHVVRRDGDRERLLVDRSRCPDGMLDTANREVVGEAALTLEELFIALVEPHDE